MSDPRPDDAAEEIRRLRAQIRSIVTWVVIALVVGAMIYAVVDGRNKADKDARDFVDCLRTAPNANVCQP